jgi:surfactin synthase thioesterase subunit
MDPAPGASQAERMSAAARATAVRQPARVQARRRLFCFPYGGGGAAAFRNWQQGLADDIEVVAMQLPGRETRLRETPLDSIDAMVEACLPLIEASSELPYALFGHSLGALVAFEAALALESHAALRAPSHVFVSARRPPDEKETHAPLAGLDDAGFVAQLQERYSAIPEAVMQEPELLALFLPTLRADIGAFERYVCTQGQVASPLHVYGGTRDRNPLPSQLPGWQRVALRPIRIRLFDGDHFFMASQRAALLADIDSSLRPGESAPAPRGREPGRTAEAL